MKQFLIYLAGPISGLTFDECTGWRNYFTLNMPPEISALSPMRWKSFLKDVGPLSGTYEESPLSTSSGIYTRDRFDCTRSDAIIVNLLETEKVSIGTVMEIAWAADNDIPVILIMEEGNVHDHPMIKEACPFRVDTVDEAIDLVVHLLMPEPIARDNPFLNVD